MSLRNTIKEAAKAGFNAIGDVPSTYTVKKKATGVFDPASNTHTDATTSVTFEGVQSNYQRHEIDGVSVLANDQRIILLIADASEANWPTPEDKITIGSSDYDIVDTIPDPVGATLVVQARR